MSTNFTASQLHGGRRWCFPFTPVNGTTGANPEPDVPFVENDRAMVRIIPAAAAALLAALILASELPAQVRVTPKEAKGGQPQGEPWADVPEGFRNLKIPEWPLPTDLKRWQDTDRPRTRAALLKLLGEMPPRPDPAKAKVLSKEDQGDYVLE